MDYQNEQEESVTDSQGYATPPPPPTPQDLNEDDLPPLKPSNWLWQSIVATLLCCFPFGIVGIIYAIKVDTFYFNGRYEDAERMAQNAKRWTLLSIIGAFVYLVFWVFLMVTGNLPEYLENIIENNASGYNF